MKLSELKTGERGVIVKVNGHGGFRKRIKEMGFVKGNQVKVILNAPLRDPIEYEIINYKISLRREQAEKIAQKLASVVTEDKYSYKVGILDADITGPSIPQSFGIHERATGTENELFPATTKLAATGRYHPLGVLGKYQLWLPEPPYVCGCGGLDVP